MKVCGPSPKVFVFIVSELLPVKSTGDLESIEYVTEDTLLPVTLTGIEIVPRTGVVGAPTLTEGEPWMGRTVFTSTVPTNLSKGPRPL